MSVPEFDDQNKIEFPLSFKESEANAVFLVYQGGLSAEVETWLGDDVEGIKEDGYGYMLTELEGKYYAHQRKYEMHHKREVFQQGNTRINLRKNVTGTLID